MCSNGPCATRYWTTQHAFARPAPCKLSANTSRLTGLMLTGPDTKLIKGLKPSNKVQMASAFAANPSCLPSRARMSREALSNVGRMSASCAVNSWCCLHQSIRNYRAQGLRSAMTPTGLTRQVTDRSAYLLSKICAHCRLGQQPCRISHYQAHPMRRECLPQFLRGHRKL